MHALRRPANASAASPPGGGNAWISGIGLLPVESPPSAATLGRDPRRRRRGRARFPVRLRPRAKPKRLLGRRRTCQQIDVCEHKARTPGVRRREASRGPGAGPIDRRRVMAGNRFFVALSDLSRRSCCAPGRPAATGVSRAFGPRRPIRSRLLSPRPVLHVDRFSNMRSGPDAAPVGPVRSCS